ncbi:MAG: peptidoglycan recognition protein family protein, partial [Acidimicrobiales bacterium]
MRKGPTEFAPVSKLVVHHTVTENDEPDPASTVRAIYAYHTQVNGWNDIGYNFVVDSAGRTYEGRYARDYRPGEVPTGENEAGEGVVGAHVGGNNTGSVGIAVLGDFSLLGPTNAAVDSLVRMLAWESGRHLIDPLGTATWSTGELPTIVGHRDVGATACPGEGLYSRLPAIRQAVANLVGPLARFNRTTTGYWVVARNTALWSYGNTAVLALTLLVPTPVRSIAATPTGSGFWLLSANGRVSPFGDAAHYGSTEGMNLNAPAVRLEPTATGKGYWVQAGDGGIFSFGDAAFHGSTGDMVLNAPVISMAATPTGQGYWLVAADGGVFTFGDAGFFGSAGGLALNAPVVGLAATPSGRGYWLVAGDGGVFTYGDARFFGSAASLRLARPVTGMAPTASGAGYWLVAGDGGILTLGDAPFFGSATALGPGSVAVGMAADPSGAGYWLVAADGGVWG